MAYLFLPKWAVHEMPHRSEGVKSSYEIGDFIVKGSLAQYAAAGFPIKMAKNGL